MKLVYFNGRGLAETSRMLFAVGKEDYEDFRYPLEIIDFATHKMVKEDFDKDKKDGNLIHSLNKLPYLELGSGETVICQSKSIERFLARRFNMMGESDIESARIDSLCECIRDFKDMYQKVRSAENKEEAMTTWFTETLVERLSLLENLVDGDGYSVGKRVSLSDIVIFTFITQFFDNKGASLNATLATPKIRSIIDRVGSLPEIVSWIEKRPETGF